MVVLDQVFRNTLPVYTSMVCLPFNQSQQMQILDRPLSHERVQYDPACYTILPKHFENFHLFSAPSIKLFHSSTQLAFSHTWGLNRCK